MNSTEKNKNLADKAQNALDQLSKGEKTINKVRQEIGLEPINDGTADEIFINNKSEVTTLNYKKVLETSDLKKDKKIAKHIKRMLAIKFIENDFEVDNRM